MKRRFPSSPRLSSTAAVRAAALFGIALIATLAACARQLEDKDAVLDDRRALEERIRDLENERETMSTKMAKGTRDREIAKKQAESASGADSKSEYAEARPAAKAAAPAAPQAAPVESDRLRSLGYIGGSAPAYESAQPRALPAPPPHFPPLVVLPPSPASSERYQKLDDNPLHLVAEEPVSTFSLDVDTGSYSNVRRFIEGGQLPPVDAVRVEELVNYFPYDYPSSEGEHPFGFRSELAPCPWNPEHWLLRVAVRAEDVDAKEMPPANLVFLVDVSGSMGDDDKLPLLKRSLLLLVRQLRREDRLSLVVYAGSTGVVLEPTPGDEQQRITQAIEMLQSGGATAGEAGIRLAYRMARQGFLEEGINRVLLATDGDFNVGITDFEELKHLVERERESGVQLSTLGFGEGNLNDQLMEQLADVGNGSYAYIDDLAEGRKVLVDQMRSTIVTVAKDVKVQMEFNPALVSEYRLLGYENRVLAREDFHNDRVDAGDVGAGQSVTALYELTPVGAKPSVDPLRYAPGNGSGKEAKLHGPPSALPPAHSEEIAFLRIRYKKPDAATSRLIEVPVTRSALLASFEAAGEDFRFATAVAGFGQLLRGGKHIGRWTMDDVLGLALGSRGRDEYGYRSDFVSLVRSAKVLS